ncbi:sensor histidine kinase [Desulfosporosinus youngiae]|uniref:histidine kinase n=1 Tax=Desulfosporosinus youngiae DSM 17734 TaxID=768710 RepID=H5XWU5_9FIRM|nr:HAMP domain-containing sensor histidine kinase [Desulfosporosinus youngiae]EHQ90744.1 signal transduction histidine kinase [Desulfosporosinus youngiae DSM 17734]
MKKKLSNQFLTNYMVVFLLTILTTAFAFMLLSFASGLISDTLAKNRFPASSIIKEDYTKIDASPVVQNGGGVQVVDKEYRVIYSNGLDTIGKSQLSAEEFTGFLTESKGKSYHYDILYQPGGEFWLIVTFPTSIRLDFSLVYNKEASAGDFVRAGGAMVSVALIYLLMLALFTFLFSRITAASITVPLRKLCDGTRLLREGDYSVRVDLRLKNEFAELQNTFNDMAARIEHEISLRKKSEDNRRRLILDISHDLKNPMSSIQGYAEMCMKKPELPEQERGAYLQTIHQNSRRANRLLTELFELSQMDSPDFSIKPIKTELCEYLRQVCGGLVPQLERAGFRYEFEIPEESVFALLDTERFGRIIQNLSDNTVRYNPQGTTVAVGLTAQDHQAVIHFHDDGSGIPAHLTEDIFKPFVRADNSRNSKTGGSGLGLSIAKKIAQAHGGDLTLDSDGNKGSTFRITVPTI